MLDVSRLEAGRLRLRRTACALGDIVRASLEELQSLLAARQQELTCDIAEIPPIDADPDKLHQVVTNLVANSIKYTPSGGSIRVTVDEHSSGSGSPPRARLRVWDNGIGVPPGLHGKIFEPFSEVNAAKHHTSTLPDSAGLGLYIARGMVELHGGTTSGASNEGQYSGVTVLLPFAST